MNKKFNVIGLFICLFCIAPILAIDTRTQVTKDFMQAVEDKDFQMADQLLLQGADINGTDELGWNALHSAVYLKHFEQVKYLVGKGADKEAVSGVLKEAPLHSASEEGSLDIVTYLVEQGANKDAMNVYQETPLHRAAKEGRLEIIEYLVQQGADVTIKNEDGKTPLQIAEENGKAAVVDYLNSVTPSMRIYYRAKALIKNNWGKIAIVSGLGLGFAAGLRWWYARRTGVSFIPKITWFNRKNSQQIQALAPKSFVPVNRL